MRGCPLLGVTHLRSECPPCPITVDGEPLIIRPQSAADTVADLARALCLADDVELTIGGMIADASQALTSTGLLAGAEIVHGSAVDAEQVGPVQIAVVAGPSCQPWRSLTTGRHAVGRAPTASIEIDDSTVELHHGVIEVTDGGRVVFNQLTGRVPARVAGQPCSTATALEPGDTLDVGASRLAFRSAPIDGGAAGHLAGSVVLCDHDPWRRVVRRAPLPSEPAQVDPIEVPQPPGEHRAPPVGGLAGAGIAALGAGLMAAMLGQPMFALFGLFGALASAATWAAAAGGARRRRARARATHHREIETFVARLDSVHETMMRSHGASHPDIVDSIVVDHRTVWQQRSADGPPRVCLGSGNVRARAPIEERDALDADLIVAVDRCERLVDVAVPLTLAPSAILALHGHVATATAAARSLVVQLAVRYGPSDLGLVIVTDRIERWSWANWLPHGGAGGTVVFAADQEVDLADAGRSVVVVTDVPGLLTSRTGAFRRALDASAACCVVIVSPTTTVPSACQRVLDVSVTGLARWSASTSLDDDAIRLAGITVAVAERAARHLAPLIDPEDAAGPTAGLVQSLQLRDLRGLPDAATIARRWRANGQDPALAATIGLSHDGTVEIDLVRDGPHGLVAGTTGAGKSELLRTLIVSLAARVSPDHLSFVLIDFKGGSTFDACARLAHTVGVVTDLDEGLAERALVSLDAEIRRRERLLRGVGADDLAAYRQRTSEPLPRLVVVVDEFASLAKDLPEFLGSLVSIAQRGRSLGIHLILATQRPAGVVTDDIRANTNLRIALRLHDRGDAIDVVGDDRPARFPKAVPGRAALRLGPDELVVFQTASCTGPPPRGDHCRLVIERPGAHLAVGDGIDARTELTVLADAVRDAWAIARGRAPHRPWIDPLPQVLARTDVPDPTVLGIIDDPAGQTRRPLRWDRSTGNLFLVGTIGSGTTSTAFSIALSLLRSNPPSATHIYVLDGHGEPRYDSIASTEHCGGVVRLGERERVDRLLRRLSCELDQRTLTGERTPEIVMVVDGLGSVRSSLAPIERGDAATRLDRVLRDGPAVGIVSCITTDGSAVPASIPGHRWLFDAPDRTARTATPGRIGLSDSGLSAQTIVETEPLASIPCGGHGGPPPIEVLPEWVDAADLAVRIDAEEADHFSLDCSLLVGVGADDLEPASLRVPAGDHVFIGGGSRTGTSTALGQLVSSWRGLHPGGSVIGVDRQRPLDPAVVEERGAREIPMLVAVDDADRVEDPTGVLAGIIAGRRPGITVIAAARLESVRVAYGHWVREVTRSRCGLIMTSAGEVDGELLGVTLPRRSTVPARPGLAWMIDGRGHQLVQVAARMRV